MKYFWIYFIVINFITLITYGIDKHKARKYQWRISENMLMGLALIGGFVGAFLGMQLFRHKTRHMKFVIGVPVIAIVWIVALLKLKGWSFIG